MSSPLHNGHRLRDRAPFWWLLFALLAVLILTAAPGAARVFFLVRDTVGREFLRWTTVLATAVVALVLARRLDGRRLAWGLGVLLVTVAVMIRLSVPGEAIHLLEYGTLSVLAGLALRTTVRDGGVYLVAASLAAAVGLLDELYQWLTPNRYWDIHDVLLNAAGSVLGQVLLAGLRPAGITPRPRWRSVALGLTLAALVAAAAAFVQLVLKPAS